MNATQSNDAVIMDIPSKKIHLTKMALDLGVKRTTLTTTLYGYNNNRWRFYELKELKKRNGDVRTIHAVNGSLWYLQKKTYNYLSSIYKPHAAAKGFVKEGGIVVHAKIHRNKKLVMSYDIKDFFPTITFARVSGMFQFPPFNFPIEEAIVYAQICCLPDENGSLPQGGITSPYISNMLCRKLDDRLLKFANKRKLNYSRYADDLTFSTNENINFKKITEYVAKTLKEEGFQINDSKTRLMKKSDRQVVTGVIVNEGINVNRKYIRSLRALIHNCSINNIYKEATKKRNYNKYSWDRIYCLPYQIKEDGTYIKTNGRRINYKNKATGQRIPESEQVQKLFIQHVEGRLDHVRHIANSNPHLEDRVRRLIIYQNLKLRWDEVKKNDLEIKGLYEKTKFYKPYTDHRNSVKMATNHDVLDEIIKKLKDEYNDIRFYKDFSTNLEEKKKEMLIMLRYPPVNIDYMKKFIFTLSKTDNNVMRNLIHRQDIVSYEELMDTYREFGNTDKRHQLNQNIQSLITTFFKDYQRYFKNKGLKELKPGDHPQLWNNTIAVFKNKTRFSSRTDIQGSPHFSKHIENQLMNNNNIKLIHVKKLQIDDKSLRNDKFGDIYTDVENAQWAANRLIESMLKNSPQESTITFKRFNEEEVGEALSIENTNSTEETESKWRNRKCFHGKLTKVLCCLNGLAYWYITFNTKDGRVTYDVYKNDFCKQYLEGTGFKHTIIFPDPD